MKQPKRCNYLTDTELEHTTAKRNQFRQMQQARLDLSQTISKVCKKYSLHPRTEIYDIKVTILSIDKSPVRDSKGDWNSIQRKQKAYEKAKKRFDEKFKKCSEKKIKNKK
jgi:hypothetical protein